MKPSAAMTRVLRLARQARAVREPLRFAAAEVRRDHRVGRYTLRSSGLRFHVRHHANDLGALEDVVLSGEYEPPAPVARWLAARPGGPRVLDLGGHVGFFALDAVHRWPGARITALEPDPRSAELYRATIAANGLGDAVRLLERVAAAAPGTADFASGLGVSSYAAGSSAEHPSRPVQAIDVLPLMAEADLVKMDIEGGEWAILEDPRAASAVGPVIVLEFHDRLCPFEDAEAAVTAWLEQAGLHVWPDVRRLPGMGLIWAFDPALLAPPPASA